MARAADHFVKQNANGGRFNIEAAQAARDACQLLGFDVQRAKIDKILAPLTMADLLRGAITNITLSADTKAKPLRRPTLDELEAAYPKLQSGYVSELLSNGPEHWRLCLARQYEEALSKAVSELDEAEVCLAKALLGDFEAFELMCERFPTRRNDMQVVRAIELHRHGLLREAETLSEALTDKDLDWAPPHLALGFSGRVPWPYYPFPDY